MRIVKEQEEVMFEEDLLNDLKKLSLTEVSEKYNLSFKELFDISLKLNNKNNIKINEDTYISKTKSKKWAIRKSIKGKMCYYGTYKFKKEASLVVKELIKVDWDIEELPVILERLGIERCERKY